MSIKVSAIALATAAGMFMASAAFADTIVVSPDQRALMQDYVVKQKIKPRKFKRDLSVGATLPDDVVIQTVPETWGPSLRRYSYVYGDEHFYFVDPADRTIVHIE